MLKKEILELLELRGWTQADLARHAQVTEAAVSCWLSGRRPLKGPAMLLLRRWLDDARAEKAELAAV